MAMMGTFLNIIIILGLTRLLRHTQKPFLVSGIYTFIRFCLSLLFSVNPDFIGAFLISGPVFLLSSGYFWLLWRFEDHSIAYWIILLAGILIGII